MSDTAYSPQAITRVAHFMRRAHSILESTIDEVPEADLGRRFPQSTANTIAGTYFHIACGYERLVSRELRGGPTIYDRDGWGDRLPVNVDSGPGDPWFETINVEQFAILRGYVGAVLTETTDWVAAMTVDEANRPVHEQRFGEGNIFDLLIWPMLFHTSHHMGEISALIGMCGRPGLPF